MTTGTLKARRAGLQSQAATTARAPRRLGLVMAVIATAELMIALDLTIVNVAQRTSRPRSLFLMRVRREDLSGTDPAPEPPGDTSSPRLA